MASNSNSAPPVKQLSLEQVIARYRSQADESLLNKLFNQVSSYSVPHASGGPLKTQTLAEYKCISRTVILKALSAGQRRDLPCLAELLLRPSGPRMLCDLLKVVSDRRKGCIVCASLVARAFPELNQTDRESAQKAWQAQLRSARAAFEAQKRNCNGYGGDVSPDNLPSWDKIQEVITRMQPGDVDRLILRFYSELKFKEPYSLNAVFLNPGNVRIYRPSEKHAAPTLQQMHAMAEDDNSPAGFFIMDKDARKYQIYLVLGFGADKETVAMQQLRVPTALAQEIRAYLATRPPSQKYLIVDQKHSVSLDCAKPYSSEAGRASFMARLNRLLVKHFDCRCRQFRVACALHHSELARKEMMEDFEDGH